MSSTSAGQLDSYLSLKSTPDAEVDTLQLTKQTLNTSASPNIKSESPFIDVVLYDDPTRINLNQLGGDKVEKLSDDINKFSHKESSYLNPDETIQHNTTYISSDEKKLSPESTNNGSSVGTSQKEAGVKNEGLSTLADSSILLNEEGMRNDGLDSSKVSAYARLEFENFTFYLQTLEVVLGRKSEHDQSHSVDVHLGASKAISRKHARIFYNFGTERFELSIQGKNGAFVDDVFIERGATVPLTNKSKIQVGQIVFRFVLPGMGHQEKLESPSKPINPSDAVFLRSTLYTNLSQDGIHHDNSNESTPQLTSKDFEPVKTLQPEASSIPDLATTASPSSKPAQVPESTTVDSPESATASSEVTAAAAAAASEAAKKLKEKKVPKPPKPPKKVYTIDEIPEEYRTKPACSYSNLIATCLRTHGTSKGMSLAEIYKSIRDIFPYYKYCADGWQSSVRHNLSLNKAFRKVSKEGKGWLWGLDEEYCAEKERAKKKQAAAAAAKAKAAALKLEQQQQQQQQQQRLQQQRLEQQKQLQIAQAAQQQFQQQSLQGQTAQQLLGSLNIAGLPLSNLGLTAQALQGLQGQQLLNAIGQAASANAASGSASTDLNNQKLNLPLQAGDLQQQIQPQQPGQDALTAQLQQQNIQLQALAAGLPQQTALNNQGLAQSQTKLLSNQLPIQPSPPPPQSRPDPSQIPVFKSSKPAESPEVHQQHSNKVPSIQAQLAANRGILSPSTPSTARPNLKPGASTPSTGAKPIGADTKKALAHLQQQLVLLSKDLRTLVDKPTISAILTQAIAMTIAQVTQAAKTKGITTDPLATLIESNPNQLTRILTVALNAASYKVTNGRIKNPLSLAPTATNSNASSRGSTPGPSASAKPMVSQIPKFTPGVQPSHIQAQQAAAAAAAKQKALLAASTVPKSEKTTPPPPVVPTTSTLPVAITNNQSNPVPQFVPPQTIKSFSNPAPSSTQPLSTSAPASHNSTPLLQEAPLVKRASADAVPKAPDSTAGPSPSTSSTLTTAHNTSFSQPESTSTPLQNHLPQSSSPQVSLQATTASPVKTEPSPLANVESTALPNPPAQVKLEPVVTQPVEKEQSTPVIETASDQNPKVEVPEVSPADNEAQPLSITSSGTLPPTLPGPNSNPVPTQTKAESASQPSNQEAVGSISKEEPDPQPTESVKGEQPNIHIDSFGIDDSLKFLEDDLNDPEFSKVLESLSKEGTPGVEDGKVMNDDELNRLLSSDFTEITGSGASKRSFDQLDDTDINESSKLQKT